MALIRLFIDTGARAGEVVGLSVDDVDLANSYALVMGKGAHGRTIVVGARTTDVLRRYLKARLQDKQAGGAALWLGRKGALQHGGVARLLERRGAEH